MTSVPPDRLLHINKKIEKKKKLKTQSSHQGIKQKIWKTKMNVSLVINVLVRCVKLMAKSPTFFHPKWAAFL